MASGISINIRSCSKWKLYCIYVPRNYDFSAIARNKYNMMMSSNGNIFRVTGPFCGEFTGHRRIPLTKASDAELWCFLWSAPWINGWVNNRVTGDLSRYRDHYNVILKQCLVTSSCPLWRHWKELMELYCRHCFTYPGPFFFLLRTIT